MSHVPPIYKDPLETLWRAIPMQLLDRIESAALAKQAFVDAVYIGLPYHLYRTVFFNKDPS
jgi:hypothetical protein